MTRPGSTRSLRAGAGVGAGLTGWLALDSFVSGGLASGRPGGLEFLLFWGLPLTGASLFLAWVSVRGGGPGTRRVARSGCLGAFLAGGGVCAILLAAPLVLPWDALHGAVAAVQFGPLAAMLGGLAGLVRARMRERRR